MPQAKKSSMVHTDRSGNWELSPATPHSSKGETPCQDGLGHSYQILYSCSVQPLSQSFASHVKTRSGVADLGNPTKSVVYPVPPPWANVEPTASNSDN